MSELNLLYKQFCIFNAGLKNPFNEWSDELIEQGFSIRKESLSIMTISNAGLLDVNIMNEDKIIEGANRIVEFEFKVKRHGVEIATATDSLPVKVEKGVYKVRVQLCSEEEGKDICYISFLEKEKGERFPKYLKYDAEIKRRADFILDSKAAN